jgi:hypothetical protein
LKRKDIGHDFKRVKENYLYHTQLSLNTCFFYQVWVWYAGLLHFHHWCSRGWDCWPECRKTTCLGLTLCSPKWSSLDIWSSLPWRSNSLVTLPKSLLIFMYLANQGCMFLWDALWYLSVPILWCLLVKHYMIWVVCGIPQPQCWVIKKNYYY